MNEKLDQVLLGTIIGNADSGVSLPDGITVVMFQSSKDKAIFTAISAMLRDGIAPNLVLLSERLAGSEQLKDVNIPTYLAELTSLPGTSFPSQINHYAESLKRQVKDKDVVRAIKEAAEGVKNGSPELVVPELLRKIADYGNGDERQSFKFSRLDSVEVKPASWIVNGLIETESFCCLYGDSGAGKSFLAIELAACIATGRPFHGIPTKQGPVIYLAGEGQSGLARRFKAWSIARCVSLEGAPLYLSAGAMALIEPSVMGPVCNALEKLIREIGNPSLVILDTWSRVLGGDDSSPSDAAAGVAALDGLRARFGNFAAMVVHHEGHAKGRGRGWSGLRAAVDMEYRAERGTDGVLRVQCTKAKDTGIMDPMAFQFMGVELPVRNEYGEPLTSAVLDRVEWTPPPKAGQEPVMGKNQSQALDILKTLTVSGPVTVSIWQEKCKTAGMDRNQFWYAKKGLEKTGYINLFNEFVYCRGVALGVGNGGLLYSPPVPPNAPTTLTPVGNIEKSTLSNASNGAGEKVNDSFNSFAGDVPEGMSGEEYRDCFDAAYKALAEQGLSHNEAARAARDEIHSFVLTNKPPGHLPDHAPDIFPDSFPINSFYEEDQNGSINLEEIDF